MPRIRKPRFTDLAALPLASKALDNLGRLRADFKLTPIDPRKFKKHPLIEQYAPMGKALKPAGAASPGPAGFFNPLLPDLVMLPDQLIEVPFTKPTDAGQLIDYSHLPLFSPPLMNEDMVQGNIGDCWNDAGITIAAGKMPGLVRDQTRRTSEPGIYTVDKMSFSKDIYGRINQRTIYRYTVDSHFLPKDTLGIGPRQALYPRLHQYAMAYFRTGSPSYQGLNWGFIGTSLWAMGILTVNVNPIAAELDTILASACVQGQGWGFTTSGSGIFVTDHAYKGVVYDPIAKVGVAFNPWGFNTTFTRAQLMAQANNFVVAPYDPAYTVPPMGEDLNRDGKISVDDFNQWLTSVGFTGPRIEDVDGSGVVDLLDMDRILETIGFSDRADN